MECIEYKHITKTEALQAFEEIKRSGVELYPDVEELCKIIDVNNVYAKMCIIGNATTAVIGGILEGVSPETNVECKLASNGMIVVNIIERALRLGNFTATACTAKYVLYPCNIHMPKNCGNIVPKDDDLASFGKVSIEFYNADFSETECTSYMFNCVRISEVKFVKCCFSSIKSMKYMFLGCREIRKITFDSFGKSSPLRDKIDMSYMLAAPYEFKCIDFGDLKLDMIKTGPLPIITWHVSSDPDRIVDTVIGDDAIREYIKQERISIVKSDKLMYSGKASLGNTDLSIIKNNTTPYKVIEILDWEIKYYQMIVQLYLLHLHTERLNNNINKLENLSKMARFTGGIAQTFFGIASFCNAEQGYKHGSDYSLCALKRLSTLCTDMAALGGWARQMVSVVEVHAHRVISDCQEPVRDIESLADGITIDNVIKRNYKRFKKLSEYYISAPTLTYPYMTEMEPVDVIEQTGAPVNKQRLEDNVAMFRRVGADYDQVPILEVLVHKFREIIRLSREEVKQIYAIAKQQGMGKGEIGRATLSEIDIVPVDEIEAAIDEAETAINDIDDLLDKCQGFIAITDEAIIKTILKLNKRAVQRTQHEQFIRDSYGINASVDASSGCYDNIKIKRTGLKQLRRYIGVGDKVIHKSTAKVYGTTCPYCYGEIVNNWCKNCKRVFGLFE